MFETGYFSCITNCRCVNESNNYASTRNIPLSNLEYPIEILLSRDIDVDTRKWKQKEDSGFHFFEIPVVEEYKPTNIVFD